MSKRTIINAFVMIAVPFAAVAQIVERPRPAGWENLVPGGRFMDRSTVLMPRGVLISTVQGQ